MNYLNNILQLAEGAGEFGLIEANGVQNVAYISDEDDAASFVSAESDAEPDAEQDNHNQGADSAADVAHHEQEGDNGSQAAADDMQDLQGEEILDEQVLGGRGQPVSASDDYREFHFQLSRCTETDSFGLLQTRFFGVGIRWVQFADQHRVVGWCNHPGCAQRHSHIQPLYEGADYPTAAAAHYTAGQTLICEKAAAVLASWGGAAALQQQLGNLPPSSDDGVVTVQFNPIGRQQAQAVRAGAGFNNWGVLMQHRSHSGWFCTGTDSHCRSHVHSCRHIQAAGADANRPCATLGAADFRRKLAKDFDFEEGKRKLKCISRLELPDSLEANEFGLLDLYIGRSTGILPVPAICRPNVQTPCSVCEQRNWSAEEHEPPCSVVLASAIVSTRFAYHSCTTVQADGSTCPGQLTVDGREHGLLRANSKLAIGHVPLYNWGHQIKVGHPNAWSTTWLLLLGRAAHRPDPGDPDAELRQKRWLWNLRSVWASATLDFLQLQDRPGKYDRGFRCPCWKNGVSVDATSVAFKKNQARILAIIREILAGSATVYGAAFRHRVFVPNQGLRKDLQAFARAGTGLTPQQLEQLIANLDALEPGRQERTLLPFLNEHRPAQPATICAVKPNDTLLACLAGTAPAAVFMPPEAFADIDRLLQDGAAALNGAATMELQAKSPLLHKFLSPHLQQGALSEDVHAVLAAVRQVADAASQPSQPQAVDERAATQAEQRRTRATAAAGLEPADGDPEQWSREEAMIRTCSWGALGPEEWQKTHLGGNDVRAALRQYAADRFASTSGQVCNKYQQSTMNLLPGIMLWWCTTCRKCIFFHVMADVESPRTVFDVLFTRFPSLPKSITMDNGCNLHDFILNREPEYFKDMRVYIDALHFAGHTQCCPAYDTGVYAAIENASLCEQKNRWIRKLEGHVSYMKQASFMYYMRHFLLCMNELEKATREGKCFWRPPGLELPEVPEVAEVLEVPEAA